MSVELLKSPDVTSGEVSIAERTALAASAYSPSTLDKIEADLRTKGSLFADRSLESGDVAAVVGSLGAFAAEKMVWFSPALANQMNEDTVFVGGVCALSTRESTLLGRGLIEDPVTGYGRLIEKGEDFDGFSDVVTVVQVFETIGLTPSASAIVLEDTLWANRVVQSMRRRIGSDNNLEQSTRQSIKTRNDRASEALSRLRGYLFESPSGLSIVRDTDVMADLTTKTDEMLAKLGLEPSENTYRYIYAGMYSYVWREIMASQGIVDDEQLMVIYEPWKHFAPEDGCFDPISIFRNRLLKEAPFMEAGSENEKIGLVAYIEPRDPNGRLLRKTMPVALLPNSTNYANFDFSKFPIVTKKTNALPEADEFQFADDIGSMTLGKNPAFLWGLVYPPTTEARAIMQQMVQLGAESKRTAKAAFQDADAMSVKDKQELSAKIKRSYSREMSEFSERLIEETQTMTRVMFGGSNEAQ
ncbi:MAG TPA: hypothetical protein VGF75_00630 [Candidatus Saccharimonadales bacterium]|jgi:hypothetical protein